MAGRDLVKVTNNFASAQGAAVVEKLLSQLQEEMETDKTVEECLERLQRYYEKRAPDGVAGLKAKLDVSGRSDTYLDAIEMKEMFVKLLERWSLYASAQKIFVYLLARAERRFNDVILPQAEATDIAGVNMLMNSLIVEPTVNECGATVFEIDHNTAMGMIYWLAEQCFVRWHK
jgi:hypothetical protein